MPRFGKNSSRQLPAINTFWFHYICFIWSIYFSGKSTWADHSGQGATKSGHLGPNQTLWWAHVFTKLSRYVWPASQFISCSLFRWYYRTVLFRSMYYPDPHSRKDLLLSCNRGSLLSSASLWALPATEKFLIRTSIFPIALLEQSRNPKAQVL